MPAFRGKDLFLSFAGSAGTVTISGDFTQVTYTPSIALLDQSAGADTDRTYVTSLKDRTIAWAAKHQASGTVLVNALVEGTSGTLTWGEEGTASGKPKHTCPVISMGCPMNIPYDNLVEISGTFQGNGAIADATY